MLCVICFQKLPLKKFWIRLVTPLAKSRSAIPIIAYHKVFRAVVTLSWLPPLVIKRNAAQITIITAIVKPISKSQVAIVSIKVGISFPLLPKGLGI